MEKPTSFALKALKLQKAKEVALKLTEKTFSIKEKLNLFFTEITNFVLFVGRTIKETFSRDFEF